MTFKQLTNMQSLMILYVFFVNIYQFISVSYNVIRPNINHTKIETRIYGGYTCPEEEYKPLVSIRNSDDKHWCSGTLINKKLVLSAAHCWFAYGFNLSVVIDRSNVTMSQRSRIVRPYFYPYFKYPFHHHDIIIFSLEDPVYQSEFVKYAILPSKNIDTILKDCSEILLKRWRETETIPTSNILQCTNVTMIDCQNVNDTSVKTDPKLYVCAQGKDNTPCNGDSGGPVLCNNIQIGIVSRGPNCDERNSPFFFTNVAAHMDFIYTIKQLLS